MSVKIGNMSPELANAIRDYILQQTGKIVTITTMDYSLINNRIHFIVDGKGSYRLNIVKGTISRPTHVGYSRVIRTNSILSGLNKLNVIRALLNQPAISSLT